MRFELAWSYKCVLTGGPTPYAYTALLEERPHASCLHVRPQEAANANTEPGHTGGGYTQSSRDMSSGLTYSNPSNSDWSIFEMTLLEQGRKRAGEHPRHSSPCMGASGTKRSRQRPMLFAACCPLQASATAHHSERLRRGQFPLPADRTAHKSRLGAISWLWPQGRIQGPLRTLPCTTVLWCRNVCA